MQVRNANKEDFEQLFNLGKEFAEVSKEAHGFSVSDEKIEEFIKSIISNDSWITLVIEVDGKINGFIYGCIIKTFFSEDLYAQEVAWYVKDKNKNGLKLMSEFEKIAEEKQCKRIIFGFKPLYADMKNLYERKGYRILESYYVREICQH